MTSPITIDAYDPDWPVRYAAEETRVRAALGPRALAVVHVGSTAVPGLAAQKQKALVIVEILRRAGLRPVGTG